MDNKQLDKYFFCASILSIGKKTCLAQAYIIRNANMFAIPFKTVSFAEKKTTLTILKNQVKWGQVMHLLHICIVVCNEYNVLSVFSRY